MCFRRSILESEGSGRGRLYMLTHLFQGDAMESLSKRCISFPFQYEIRLSH
jgi:hypothetical protein